MCAFTSPSIQGILHHVALTVATTQATRGCENVRTASLNIELPISDAVLDTNIPQWFRLQ